MTPLFAMPACDSWQVPGGILLYSRHNGAKIVVSQEVASVVQRCDRFLSLEEHAQRLMALYPALGEQPDSVRQVLESLRSVGVLVPSEAAWDGSSPTEGGPQAADKPSICITTRDRPDLVRRLFESLLRQVRLSRFRCIYLIDDSRDPGSVRENAEAVESFRVVSPVDAIHVGPAQQRTLTAALSEAVPEVAEALACLLDPGWWGEVPTYGRARNLALLVTAGQRCLMLDDDVLCEAWRSPGEQTGLAFWGNREADFLKGPADLQRFVPLDEDPLSAQIACLGSPLDAALRKLGHHDKGPDLLRDAPAELLGRVAGDSPILVTQCGTLGDPGTEDNSWLAMLDQASVRRLLDHPGGVPAAFASRQVWLGYPVPTFTDMANMSQLTGLDNRQLLPPYLSGLRGEDRLFGTVTGYLHPRGLVLDYPWAIAHRPQPERSGNPQGDIGIPRGGLNLLDDWLMERLPTSVSGTPASRLLLLAGQLGVLAEHSDSDLRSDFGRLLTASQVERLQRIDAQLQATGGASADWSAWLSRNREALWQALQEAPTPTASPLVPAGTSETTIWSALRNTAGAYSKLLQHWQALRSAATEVSLER